ncbi:UPF0262 family protein [Pendulispora albinea]|uniref:UPF0262 family protein n=1 Tax=Pendulispora albinea TaxID=2741071 RepID=A0ABZ2LLT7_9BACT
MTTIRDIRVPEDLWERASFLRRAEWRATIEDLLHDARLSPKYAGYYLLVTPKEETTSIEFLDEEGEVRASVVVSHSVTEVVLREYLQIIKKMDLEAHETGRLEALDMGKKVVHDAAARELRRTLPDLAEDHATYRKLFTLLVALQVDTTKLVHARSHAMR